MCISLIAMRDKTLSLKVLPGFWNNFKSITKQFEADFAHWQRIKGDMRQDLL